MARLLVLETGINRCDFQQETNAKNKRGPRTIELGLDFKGSRHTRRRMKIARSRSNKAAFGLDFRGLAAHATNEHKTKTPGARKMPIRSRTLTDTKGANWKRKSRNRDRTLPNLGLHRIFGARGVRIRNGNRGGARKNIESEPVFDEYEGADSKQKSRHRARTRPNLGRILGARGARTRNETGGARTKNTESEPHFDWHEGTNSKRK